MTSAPALRRRGRPGPRAVARRRGTRASARAAPGSRHARASKHGRCQDAGDGRSRLGRLLGAEAVQRRSGCGDPGGHLLRIIRVEWDPLEDLVDEATEVEAAERCTRRYDRRRRFLGGPGGDGDGCKEGAPGCALDERLALGPPARRERVTALGQGESSKVRRPDPRRRLGQRGGVDAPRRRRRTHAAAGR